MKSPGMDSRYARKVRGDYPPNSPYRTGNWGQPCRKLREPFVIVAVIAERIAGRLEDAQPARKEST